MNKKHSYSVYIFLLLFLLSCEEKPKPPVITTNIVTEITTISAVSGGNITDDGGAPIISKGVCWNTSENPTIDINKTTERGESLSFTSNISQLEPSTSYFVRAYAVNSAGTSYGKSVSFKTLGDKPASNSQNASNIQLTTATLNGLVNPNSLETTVTFEYGTTTSYGSTVMAQQSSLSGDTDVNVSVDLTELKPGTLYHFRIKAENSLGITYSSNMTFTTLGSVPSPTIEAATNIQVYSATLNGSVNPNYLSSTIEFEWGTTLDYGNIITPSQSPVTGSNSVNVSTDLSGLAPGTTYHFRINATNELGTTNSYDLTFKTLGDVPSAKTESATNLQYNSATVSGSVNPNYLATTVVIEYGTTLSYGNTISITQSPLSGNNNVNVSADLSGLSQGTIYHIRISATNELGTTKSDDFTFTTLEPITDVDGNVYNIKTIDTQVWMTENLKTTKYSNGDDIGTTVPTTLDISNELSPKYQWAYEGDENNVPIYGRLYTGYAAKDTRNVCPVGWHVPSDEEWTILTDYLISLGYGFEGSGDDIGKSMAYTLLWNSDPTAGNVGNDIESNNRSGFSAVPAGMRSNDQDVDGIFVNLGYFCSFWSSTELTSTISWQRIMFYSSSTVNQTYSGGKQSGISIRCIKD